MTTGELFTSHSTAPSGSSALYNLQTLCQDGGCGEYGLIPITDITCDLTTQIMGANLIKTLLSCDIISDTINADLSVTSYQADLKDINLECELCQ